MATKGKKTKKIVDVIASTTDTSVHALNINAADTFTDVEVAESNAAADEVHANNASVRECLNDIRSSLQEQHAGKRKIERGIAHGARAILSLVAIEGIEDEGQALTFDRLSAMHDPSSDDAKDRKAAAASWFSALVRDVLGAAPSFKKGDEVTIADRRRMSDFAKDRTALNRAWQFAGLLAFAGYTAENWDDKHNTFQVAVADLIPHHRVIVADDDAARKVIAERMVPLNGEALCTVKKRGAESVDKLPVRSTVDAFLRAQLPDRNIAQKGFDVWKAVESLAGLEIERVTTTDDAARLTLLQKAIDYLMECQTQSFARVAQNAARDAEDKKTTAAA